MRKILILLTLIPVMVSCVVACSSQVYEFSEDVAVKPATQSTVLPQQSEATRQYIEVLKSIRFEKDTFYLGEGCRKKNTIGCSSAWTNTQFRHGKFLPPEERTSLSMQ